MTTLTERVASLQADTHSDRSTISVPALQILGKLAEQHFVAIVAALERLDEYAVELRQLEETLAGLGFEAPARRSAQPPTAPRRVRESMRVDQ